MSFSVLPPQDCPARRPAPRVPGRRPTGRRPHSAAHPLRALAYELTVAEARERARIACGLHDDLGQWLTLARLKLGELGPLVDGPAQALVGEVLHLVGQAAQSARSVTFDLCSPLLQLGLQSALQGLADRLGRDGRLAVQLRGELPALELPEQVQAVVFRVVRELCLNVQKHAAASELVISVALDDVLLRVTVEDDGTGFRPEAVSRRFSPEGGFGLASAQAQMRALGGCLRVASQPGCGTWVSLTLPLGPEKDKCTPGPERVPNRPAPSLHDLEPNESCPRAFACRPSGLDRR